MTILMGARRLRHRLGMTAPVAAAALASGGLSLAALSVATRSLGAARAAPLAVAWTLAVVVGPGLWSSVEQESARGLGGDMRALVVRRAAVVALAVLAVGLLLRHRLFAGSVAVPVAIASMAAAYGPLHVAWGRLAAAGRRTAIAASVSGEGVLRLVLVGGAVRAVDRAGAGALALAAAVGVCAALTSAAARDDAGDVAGDAALRRRLRALTIGSVLSQVVLLGGPAAFELLTRSTADPRTARLALAVVLARAPALAWKGVMTAVVPAVAVGGARTFALVRRTALWLALAGGPLAAVVAALAGDPVLDLLGGEGPPLGAGPLALLALGTAAQLGALAIHAARAASGEAVATARAWAAGAVVALVCLAVPGDPLWRVLAAFAAGASVAFIALLQRTRR